MRTLHICCFLESSSESSCGFADAESSSESDEKPSSDSESDSDDSIYGIFILVYLFLLLCMILDSSSERKPKKRTSGPSNRKPPIFSEIGAILYYKKPGEVIERMGRVGLDEVLAYICLSYPPIFFRMNTVTSVIWEVI